MKIIKELKINKDVFLKAYDLCKFKEKPIKIYFFYNNREFIIYFKSFCIHIETYEIDLCKIDKQYVDWHCRNVFAICKKTKFLNIRKKLSSILYKGITTKWEDILYFNIDINKNGIIKNYKKSI